MPNFVQNGKVYSATWETTGPSFLSNEDTRYGQGRLGIDYTLNMDSRWSVLCLGPLINTLNLTPAGGTAANTNGIALSEGMNATKYIYLIRGTKWAKVQASNMTLISNDTETALAERATGILYTKNAAGTEEISVFMNGTAYRVITTVSAGATDTHSANNETIINRAGNYGWPGNTILAGGGQVIRHNVLTGSVGMDASAWQTRATLVGESLVITSVVLDGDKVLVGTNNGPYYFDNDFRDFRPLIQEISTDPDNKACSAMTTWFPVGVLVNLKKALYRTKNSVGSSCGPEVYPANESPIQGYFTALWGSERWLYGALYNPGTDKTHILAGHVPTEGEPFQDKLLSWFPIATLGDGVECEALRDIETYGGRANATMVGGHDDDLFWFTQGRLAREIDDANYLFSPSGSAYFTELRRERHLDKYPVGLELETTGCDAGKTVTVYMAADGGSYEQVGSPITTNGIQRIHIPAGDNFHGSRLKIRVDAVTDSSSSSPKVLPGMTLFFRMAEREIDGSAPGWV